MRKRVTLFLSTSLLLSGATGLLGAEVEAGFTSLSDGKTFDGWKSSTDHADTWKLEDGAFVTRGQTAHLFYVGPLAPFTNFDLRVDVMSDPGANGGIYFHTKFQQAGFPRFGIETQVDNSHSDWRRTGSLYGFVKVLDQLVPPDTWFTQEVTAVGNHIVIKVNGKTTVDYVDTKNTHMKGHFAFQQHNLGSEVWIRNVQVKELPKS